jgi:hypothetical protein
VPGEPAARPPARAEAGPHDWQHVGNDWGRATRATRSAGGCLAARACATTSESHREAWKRIVRGDPCAYCGLLPFPCRFHRGDAGTVDHIDPQAGPRPAHGLHSWTNYTGSCARCNNSKDATPMLLWIARRGVLR